MISLDFSPMIISNNKDKSVNKILNSLTTCFFEELDLFIERTGNEDFGEWFSESTFLSLLSNGLIRKDKAKSYAVIQEYCIGGVGRCDGLILIDNAAILVESKMHRYIKPLDETHFKNMEEWIEWDETAIRAQLNRYYNAEVEYFTETQSYESVYLLTMVFKNIKEESSMHLKNAKELLDKAYKNKHNRTWYYSVAFINESTEGKNIGIEVYGTIDKKR